MDTQTADGIDASAPAVEGDRREAASGALQPAAERSLTLDAYRGFVMLLLISRGFGFAALEGHPTWGGIARQFQHVEWEGGVLWDMVQPAFLFLVGAAMPFALAARVRHGESFADRTRHVVIRTVKLILLSQVLVAVSEHHLRFQLINVLSQIAFAYLLTYWILQLRWRRQVMTAIGLLVGHTLLFFLFPGPAGAFSREGNIGQVIDRALLGYNYDGLYVTLNFIPATVTTLVGAWAGRMLLERTPVNTLMRRLVEGAVVSFLMVFAFWALVPGVKRIWTATFTFYSAGWVLLMLLLFYYVVDVLGWRRWTFFLTVIGANSIFIYSLDMLLRGWLTDALAVFTGGFAFAGDLAPVLQSCAVLAAFWCCNYVLFKHRVFLKL